MQSTEMQIHADTKGKVALDDITLWDNCCKKCHRNTISRFHLIALCVCGVTFSQGIVVCYTRVYPTIFDQQATTLALTIDLLNPKLVGFRRLLRITAVPSFKSFRSWVFVSLC